MSIPLQRVNTLTGISNGILGLILTIAIEAMFFGGLISAFLVQSISTAIWPPPNQPVLNSVVTNVNAALLVLSGLSIQYVLYLIGKDKKNESKQILFITLLLGSIFILIQGYEWVNLISFGFTTTSSILGSFFYVIIGAHSVHVVVGLFFLLYVYIKFAKYNASDYNGLNMIRIYWSFVVLLWPVLYSLVYF